MMLGFCASKLRLKHCENGTTWKAVKRVSKYSPSRLLFSKDLLDHLGGFLLEEVGLFV